MQKCPLRTRSLFTVCVPCATSCLKHTWNLTSCSHGRVVGYRDLLRHKKAKSLVHTLSGKAKMQQFSSRTKSTIKWGPCRYVHDEVSPVPWPPLPVTLLAAKNLVSVLRSPPLWIWGPHSCRATRTSQSPDWPRALCGAPCASYVPGTASPWEDAPLTGTEQETHYFVVTSFPVPYPPPKLWNWASATFSHYKLMDSHSSQVTPSDDQTVQSLNQNNIHRSHPFDILVYTRFP